MDHATRCSIVPPFMLEALAQSDDPVVAESASQALAHDEHFRYSRRAGGWLAAPRIDVDEPGPPIPTPPAPAPPTEPGPTEPGPPAPAGPKRTIGDAKGRRTTPGETIRAEGDPATGDPAVDEAYDGLGATWELWSAAYDRNSLDGKGMPLLATVHYGDRYDNAFWDGRQMVFGDGDGVVFDRFTRSLDVIGHELAHGVTEHTAGLLYQG
ncbi:MAG TPA: metalloprotease, partial [Intrasporangium sp.]|nr:metalloprotease [Intrasporangium sp.]